MSLMENPPHKTVGGPWQVNSEVQLPIWIPRLQMFNLKYSRGFIVDNLEKYLPDVIYIPDIYKPVEGIDSYAVRIMWKEAGPIANNEGDIRTEIFPRGGVRSPLSARAAFLEIVAAGVKGVPLEGYFGGTYTIRKAGGVVEVQGGEHLNHRAAIQNLLTGVFNKLYHIGQVIRRVPEVNRGVLGKVLPVLLDNQFEEMWSALYRYQMSCTTQALEPAESAQLSLL